MSFTYEEIRDFMLAYFPAYTEKAQDPVLQPEMDRFYAPDIIIDDGLVTGREQWYRACLSHPAIIDTLTLNKLCVDERNLFVSAMVTATPTERATGKKLMELKMNAFYTLKATDEGHLVIARLNGFSESNPARLIQLMDIYGMRH